MGMFVDGEKSKRKEERCMRKILIILVAMLMIGLCLMSYNAGKIHGAEQVILTAQPFIVEYVESPQDTFILYIDYGEPYGIEEYTAYVC